MNRFLLLVCSFVLVSSIASAQLSFDAGLQGGLAFSSFPSVVKDYYGTGFLFGGHGDLNIMKYVSVRLSFDYASFASDKTKLASALAAANNVQASDVSVTGLNTSDFSIFVDGLGKIPIQGSPFTPYGLVGFGLNFLSASDPTITYQGNTVQVPNLAGSSSTKFGLNFGAGSEFKVASKVKLLLEFKYVLIFTTDQSTSYMPIVVGASYEF